MHQTDISGTASGAVLYLWFPNILHHAYDKSFTPEHLLVDLRELGCSLPIQPKYCTLQTLMDAAKDKCFQLRK